MESNITMKQQQQQNTNNIPQYSINRFSTILRCNADYTNYFSKIINEYQNKNIEEEININTILFNSELLYLIFLTQSINKNENFLVIFNANNTNQYENSTCKIKLIFQNNEEVNISKLNFSEDKKHLIFFDFTNSKIYVFQKYLAVVENILNEKKNVIILDKFFDLDEKNINHIKFCNEILNNNNNELIIFGVLSNSRVIKLFNSNYLNQEFKIIFNGNDILDFQLIKNSDENLVLYLLNSYGDILLTSNIHNPDNLPTNDDNPNINKLQIIKGNNIPYYSIISPKYFFSFYIESEVNKNPDLHSEIICIRVSKNYIDIGIILNNKLFILNYYNFNENNEELNEIIKIDNCRNNRTNRYILKSNIYYYLLEIPSIHNVFYFLNEQNISDTQKMQGILLQIKNISIKINLNMILKIPIIKNINTNFSIKTNFYLDNIFMIQRKKNNNNFSYNIKIFDFDLSSNIYNNNDIQLINHDNNKDIIENYKELLQTILASQNFFYKTEINEHQNQKKVCDDALNELSNYLNNNNQIMNNEINLDIINKLEEVYKQIYKSIDLYGKNIKKRYENYLNESKKQKTFFDNENQINSNINDVKKRIEEKLGKIKNNENEIIKLGKENEEMLNKEYLNKINFENVGKLNVNELLERINNYTIDKIKNYENIDNSRTTINLEKLKSLQKLEIILKNIDPSIKEKYELLISNLRELNVIIKKLKKEI